MNYNFVLVEDLCDLHTGLHACERMTYVISICGKYDQCGIHIGHGSDA